MPKPRRTTYDSAAERLGLVIVTVDDLTIVRDEKGTRYENGRAVGKRRLAQLEKLVLPPAWRDVRIAADGRAHLQAIGRDAKDRVQYRYHDDWVRVRDAVKAERLLAFGRALGDIRAAVARDLKRPLDDRRAVLATAVRLIDRQLLRVGSERYARHGTRGASTLLASNAETEDGTVALRYRAKSGKKVRLRVRDRALANRLAKLRRKRKRKDARLFTYRDREGRRQALAAREINAYLVDAAAAQVSAKDFRTFAGSAMALAELAAEPPPRAVKKREKVVTATVKSVSERLRNTPAVARASYIHPAITKAYLAGGLTSDLVTGRKRAGLDRAETGLMRFLENELR